MEKFAAAGSNFKICCRDISPHDPSRGRHDGRLLSHLISQLNKQLRLCSMNKRLLRTFTMNRSPEANSNLLTLEIEVRKVN